MTSEQEIQEFERLEQQLHSMVSEMGELSKKRANDGLNPFKLRFVNTLLEDLNKMLGSAKPFEDFDKFDGEDVPTNSDVVMMLSQYAAALFHMRSENTDEDGSLDWYWLIKGKLSDIPTGDPRQFKYGDR